MYHCRCNRLARGENLDAEVSTSFTLQYRRGRNPEDEHAVIITSHAVAALNAAFETGTEEIMATLSQVATMDTKVWHVNFYLFE